MDPAFTWDQPSTQVRRQQRGGESHAARRPALPAQGVSLCEAEHRFGVTAATLRTWAKKGMIDAVLTDAGSGRQWMVTSNPSPITCRGYSRPAPASRRRHLLKRKGSTFDWPDTPDGTAMLVPRDAWDRLMDQLGNLHDAGLMLAGARTRRKGGDGGRVPPRASR